MTFYPRPFGKIIWLLSTGGGLFMDKNSISDSYFPSITIGLKKAIETHDNYCEGSLINDQYRVKCNLKGGPLGRVYKCNDITTGKDNVVKSIHAGAFTSPEEFDALAKEIQNWMKLPRCANLVNITSVFYDNNEQTLFFVMPFIYGHPKYGLELEKWKGAYHFTELDMLYTGIAVCNAMKECFQQTGSIPVHGDIKPSNIFLEFVGNRFEDKPFQSCNIRLADCGFVSYTHNYFPEEYYEQGLPPDQASDVYALVKVLGEMEECAVKDYDKENSVIHGLYEIIVTQKRWKEYNLVEILDNFLLPALQAKSEIKLEDLLWQVIRTRPVDIFYRVQDIHSKLQMVRKDDTLLEEIECLWNEAHSHRYVIQGIPLTCYIDRHYFVCAELCAKYKLAEQILHRYERMLFSLPAEQQEIFGYCYSPDLKNDFKILYALNYQGQGQNTAAVSLFHEVELESCVCYKWLDGYIDLCFALDIEGKPDEGLHIQKKLKTCINTYSNNRNQRTLFDLKCYLGVVSFRLGQTASGACILEECADKHPNNLDFLYYYGYALLLDGQITKARSPLYTLYHRCQEIRKRHHDASNRPLYPAQTIAFYSFMSAYMIGDFPIAIKDLNEFNDQLSYYQEQPDHYDPFMKNFIEESYSVYQQMHENMHKITISDIVLNHYRFYSYLEKCLSSPRGYWFYFSRRGELQVLADLHTLMCDQLFRFGKYDEIIQMSKKILSLWKDSGAVKQYLARAYGMKKESGLATHFYIESADLLKYMYPKFPPDGTESDRASAERNQMRKEMKYLGLDETVI